MTKKFTYKTKICLYYQRENILLETSKSKKKRWKRLKFWAMNLLYFYLTKGKKNSN